MVKQIQHSGRLIAGKLIKIHHDTSSRQIVVQSVSSYLLSGARTDNNCILRNDPQIGQMSWNGSVL